MPRTAPTPASAVAASAPDRGTLAREQLIAHGTRIFAAKGYSGASTREICDAAGVNVASIHYYFGDKEGLYRAVLMRPVVEFTTAFGAFDDEALTFEDSMRMFLAPFLHVVACNDPQDLEAHVMRLHLREMLEPSPAFREITSQLIVPVHQALATLLARHCGLERADTDIHQLAFAIVAMANDYCMSREFMKMLAPAVLDGPQAPARILEQLIGYASALVAHEKSRRVTRAAQKSASAKKKKTHGKSGSGHSVKR